MIALCRCDAMAARKSICINGKSRPSIEHRVDHKHLECDDLLAFFRVWMPDVGSEALTGYLPACVRRVSVCIDREGILSGRFAGRNEPLQKSLI